MTFDDTTNEFVLSSGRRFYAFDATLGIDPYGQLTYGSDGLAHTRSFTTEDRIEIASAIILRWLTWLDNQKGVTMKPLHERRRRSARETFGQCAFRYKAEYIDEADFGNMATRRGSAFHLAREFYITDLWAARQTDDFETAKASLSRALRALPLPFDAELDCRDLWKRWTERFRLPLESFYGVETQELIAYDTFLRYDLVTVPTADVLKIGDAKTNWSIPAQDALEAAWQTNFYLAAARKLFPGFARYIFEYDYVRFNAFRTVEKTMAELDEVDDAIADQDLAMAEAEEGGRFPATGGSWCGHCQVKDCPVVWNATRYSPVLAGLPEAARTVGEIAALSRAVELRQSALRAFCDVSGPVRSAGIEYAYRPTTHNRYPAAAVLSVLEDTGTVFPLYFNGTAVKPLTTSRRKYVHVADAIKALAEPTVKTEFRAKTVVEQDDREYLGTDE